MHGAMPPQSAVALHVKSEHDPPEDEELDEEELPLDDDEDDEPPLDEEFPLDDEELPPLLLLELEPELELHPTTTSKAPKHATFRIHVRSHTRAAVVESRRGHVARPFDDVELDAPVVPLRFLGAARVDGAIH